MIDLASLAKIPMRTESEMKMVDIIVLKWKCPDVEVLCAERIIRNTTWPFKLTVYDNRLNTPNTSRIWNKLIRESTCDYVCVIDSDAFVPKLERGCWLSRMMQTLDGIPTDVVVPVTNHCSTSRQRADGPSDTPRIERHHGEWSGFCFVMRKKLLEIVGPFDEDFVGYGQDSEFSVRLSRAGSASYIQRDVWVQHLHGASFKQATLSGEHDEQADRLYAQKLYLEKIAR